MYINKLDYYFDNKVWLASPTMHGEELKWINYAFDKNWITTAGENVDEVEKIAAKVSGVKYAVGLCNCTSALHLCVKLAGEKLYGKAPISHGCLEGKKVFCSDMTFDATLNPVVYEGGIPVFIDTDSLTWNMDPIALEKAFKLYPEVKLVIMAHLYGFPGQIDKIKEICKKHGALLIEDAAESLGATLNNQQTGSFGDYSAISYNGNKIITGSSGGCLLTNSLEDANKARKWSTQSREAAPWYQHEEVGYNYRISNVIAGIVRGQYKYLYEHIEQKKTIYELYKQELKDFPIQMNPILSNTVPNYWLSAMIIEKKYMCKQVRSDTESLFVEEKNKTCPTEILKALQSINSEGRPIWKPMHMQPMFRMHDFVTAFGYARAKTNAYIDGDINDVGSDIFERGLCLPSDNKMTREQQLKIIDVIKRCFD